MLREFFTTYTDYPIEELGDTPGMEAPFRECKVLSSDGNKYLRVLVDGIETEIKAGYVYTSILASDWLSVGEGK